MKNKIFFVYWFVACGLLNSVYSQCNIRQNCNDCMQISSCAWCSKPNFDGDKCFDLSLNLTSECPEEYIYNPETVVTILENREIEKDPIEPGVKSGPHVMPQRLKLKLRQGDSYELEVKYVLPKRPIDIYYLIDAKSMSIKNRNEIIYLSEQLTEYIPKMAVNLKVGLGSFVVKVNAPFVDTSPEKLRQPCEECSAPYGFIHRLNMTNDMNTFLSSIRRFQRSGSISPLNGGMDALMHTLTCMNQIGWRRNSLKYVIFVTDSGAHQEGDGKQVNISQLNDQNCHLDQYGYYPYSQLMDYPSISQINAKSKENDINIIFAVTKSELQRYNNISQDIEGSTVIELKKESIDHVSSLINNATVVQSIIEMKHNSSEEIVLIKLTKREHDEKKDLNIYRFKLEAKTCPPNANATETAETIQFYPVGEIDDLIVELQIICSCDSRQDHFSQEESPYCSNNGILDGGICQCNKNSYGRLCECVGSTAEGECRSNSTDEIICNGRGSCVCGHCICEARENIQEVIYGPYCECDNYSCERSNEILCSGHGMCACGKCMCLVGWSGSSCNQKN